MYETIQIVRVTLGPDRDNKGRLVRSETTTTLNWGEVLISPGSTTSSSQIPGPQDSSYLTAYLPAGFNVGQDDYFIVLGERYDVIGQPLVWQRHPMHTMVDTGVVVTLQRVEN